MINIDWELIDWPGNSVTVKLEFFVVSYAGCTVQRISTSKITEVKKLKTIVPLEKVTLDVSNLTNKIHANWFVNMNGIWKPYSSASVIILLRTESRWDVAVVG